MAIDALGNDSTYDYFTKAGGKFYARVPGEENYWYMGATDNVVQQYSTETEDVYSSEECTQTVVESIIKSQDLVLNWTSREYSARNVAMAFSGTIDDTGFIAVANELVTTDPVTAGGYVFCGYYNITALVIQDDTDTTTYDEGIDYIFDPSSGMIGIIIGGGIADSDVLHLDITTDVHDGKEVEYITGNSVTLELMFISCPASGKKLKADFYSVKVTANGDVPLKDNDNFLEIPFTGKCLADPSKVGVGISQFCRITYLPE